MATHTVTLTNQINVFGAEPTVKWNSMVWGTDNWSEGTITLPLVVYKNIVDNTMTASNAVGFKVTKGVYNTFVVSNAITDLFKFDSNGYYYVFKPETTDGVDRQFPSYSSSTAGTGSYTSLARTSVSWSSS